MIRQFAALLIALFCLSACTSIVHKMDVGQGNEITPDMLAKIHLGMTQAQVKEILGPPILTNMFDKNRLDYAYTYKPGHGQETVKSMTLIFKKDHLTEITGNMYSEFIK